MYNGVGTIYMYG